MGNVKAARNGSFVFFILGLGICCVSYGSPYWYAAGLRHEGIWQTCVVVGDSKECDPIIAENSDAWIKGVQATMTMALFWQIFAMIAYIVWLKKDSDVIKKRGITADGKMALAFNCLAGVSMSCAVISYGSMFDSQSMESLSWAFFLAIFSGFIQLFVSIVTLAAVGCQGPEGEQLRDMELEIRISEPDPLRT